MSVDPVAKMIYDAAAQCCHECDGIDHEGHAPAGYQILGMSSYVRVNEAAAMGCAYLNRGAVVVQIVDGRASLRWRSRRELADDLYLQLKRTFYSPVQP